MGFESIAHEAEGRKLKLDMNPFYRQNITNMAGAFRY